MSETIQSPLVGVTFRPAGTKDLVRALAIGEYLLVEREADNAHDSNAVKVMDCNGNHLGYVARDCNMELAEHLDNGGEAQAKVISFLSDIKPHLEIELLPSEEPDDYVVGVIGEDHDD